MKKRSCILILLALLILLSACTFSLEQAPEGEEPFRDGLELHFIDVGQAHATLLICDGEAMLVDGGNVSDGRMLVSYLKDAKVTSLLRVVGTHAHEDHIGGLAAVLARYPAEEIWSPVTDYPSSAFASFKEYAEKQGLELIIPELDAVYALGGARVTVLGPRREYEDPNNTSIILRVDYGQCSFLLPGDAETLSETDVMEAGCDISCGVLLAGHHGSVSSTGYRWLLEADPHTVVISCGEDNEFGHPHEEVLSRLADAEIDLLRTDMHGHIVCVCDGESYVFYTQYSSDKPANPVGKYTGVYIGNQNSKKYHKETCAGLPSEENRVCFDTREQAEAEGYLPCGRCN